MAKRFDPLRAEAEKQARQVASLESSNYTLESVVHELMVHQIELEMQNETLRQTQLALEESRDRYADLYEFAPVAYLTLTRDFRIDAINLTGAILLGEDRKQLLHSRFNRFVAPDESGRWYLQFLNIIQRTKKHSFELKMQDRDGRTWQARLDCVPIVAENMPVLVRIALADITASKLAEQEQRIAALAFESQAGMMITDPDGIIIRVNQAFTRLTGYGAEEAVGKSAALLKSGRHDASFYQNMWDSLNNQGSWMGEIWNRHKNGKIYAEWLSIAAVIGADQYITHFVGSFTDITQKKSRIRDTSVDLF